ncbi:hypothetical protein EFK50_21700 [Nocardioides marmoriginsengisoli]|uniref:Tetracyclin repressor-like C-terminal domain-containing protein n=1 Tax=Nocardioides marmoriginsengisoli TaxID=661483 RepID=A0A3N0C959_9ACTN|nr:hypothetical protein EFK50_21700 [Nocardioides marmoriginsengisoli]
MFPDSPTVIAATESAIRSDDDGVERDFSDRLLRSFLALCENPRTRQGMIRMVRASVGSARAGQAFYRVLNRTVVNPAAKATGMHASALRIELVCGQLVGLAMMRYVLQVEPVASVPAEEIVVQFAPALRATLQGR